MWWWCCWWWWQQGSSSHIITKSSSDCKCPGTVVLREIRRSHAHNPRWLQLQPCLKILATEERTRFGSLSFFLPFHAIDHLILFSLSALSRWLAKVRYDSLHMVNLVITSLFLLLWIHNGQRWCRWGINRITKAEASNNGQMKNYVHCCIFTANRWRTILAAAAPDDFFSQTYCR